MISQENILNNLQTRVSANLISSIVVERKWDFVASYSLLRRKKQLGNIESFIAGAISFHAEGIWCDEPEDAIAVISSPKTLSTTAVKEVFPNLFDSIFCPFLAGHHFHSGILFVDRWNMKFFVAETAEEHFAACMSIFE